MSIFFITTNDPSGVFLGVNNPPSGVITLDYQYTPNGGLTLSGVGAYSNVIIGSIAYSYLPKGGLTFGGSALVTTVGATTYNYLTKGGLTLGGSSTVLGFNPSTYNYFANGGLNLSGDSLYENSLVEFFVEDYHYIPNTGITLFGSAVYSNNIVPFTPLDYQYVPVGGLQLLGSSFYEVTTVAPTYIIPKVNLGGYTSIFDSTQLIATRYAPSYLDDNNSIVTPIAGIFSVVGDLQPLDEGSYRQLDAPEGYTLRGGWYFSSKTVLHSIDDEKGVRSDTIDIGGRTFYVWKSLDWTYGRLSTDRYIEYYLIMKRLRNEA